jgi:hypothetical protein
MVLPVAALRRAWRSSDVVETISTVLGGLQERCELLKSWPYVALALGNRDGIGTSPTASSHNPTLVIHQATRAAARAAASSLNTRGGSREPWQVHGKDASLVREVACVEPAPVRFDAPSAEREPNA